MRILYGLANEGGGPGGAERGEELSRSADRREA